MTGIVVEIIRKEAAGIITENVMTDLVVLAIIADGVRRNR